MNSRVRTPFSHRRFLLFLVFFLATSFTVVSLNSAYAAAAGCRTDPFIKLAGGKSLKIAVHVATSAKNIASIAYTVHLPADAQVKRVVYTGGKFRDKESITLVYDAAPDTYAVETIVHSGVSVETQLKMALRSTKASVHGLTDQVLSLVLAP